MDILPPHVWALILRDATVFDVCNVAHVCRALHELVTSRATCTCAQALLCDREGVCWRARSFWAHLRAERSPNELWDGCLRSTRHAHAAHFVLALHCGGDPSARNQVAIRIASLRGYAALVERLLRDERVDPSVDQQWPMRMASAQDHADVVDRLLRDPRVDPIFDRQCAMRMACQNGHVEVLDRLLRDSRVDPSAENQEALCLASAAGHVHIVDRLLIDPRVDPCDSGNTALAWASTTGHLSVVVYLLAKVDFVPNVMDRHIGRHGALFMASSRGHGAIVDRLLPYTLVWRDWLALRACAAAACQSAQDQQRIGRWERARQYTDVVESIRRHCGFPCCLFI